MSDFSMSNKVVQANELVQLSRWNLSATMLKIFKTLVSCIDTQNPNNGVVCITRNELNSFLDIKENDEYLKNVLKSLQRQIIEIKKDNGRTLMLSLVPKIDYPEKYDAQGLIKCYFDNDIMPFLIDLKKQFLQYDVANLVRFSSKYSLLVYEYLLSRERFERHQNKCYRVSIEELRRLTATEKKYKAIKDFDAYVLIPATDEINNAGVEYLVRYEKVKAGRGGRVVAIDFYLRTRTSFDEKDFFEVKNSQWADREI